MSRWGRRVALVLSASLCALTTPAAADPVYTVHSCEGPQGAPSGVEGWAIDRRNPPLSRATDGCAAGGPFSIELRAGVSHPADDYIRMTFFAPPYTEIRDYTIWRSFQLSDVYHVWSSEFRLGSLERFDVCFAEDGCGGRGDPADPLGPANVVGGLGRTDVTRLDFNLTCGHEDAGAGVCSSAAPAGRFQLHRADLTLLDLYPPALAAPPAGPLLAGGPLSGVQGVTLSATDRGGGVYKALAEVDGRVAGEAVLDPNGGRCAEPFGAAQPCRSSATGVLPFDTGAVPDGDHSLRLLVTDAAGNAVTWGPVPLSTSNSACARVPRTTALRLRVWLGQRHERRHLTVRRGRRVVAHGRLTTSTGQPVARAGLCVVARPEGGGAAAASPGSVVTDARGRFRYRVSTRMSRRVWFVHRTGAGVASAGVSVGVRAPVRLRLSRPWLRNRQTLVLSGRVGGRPRPREGVIVELQARREGGWQTFATARARRGGRFRHPYRFTRTSGMQRYRLRARVPRQPEYPFAAGASRPVSVLVYG